MRRAGRRPSTAARSTSPTRRRSSASSRRRARRSAASISSSPTRAVRPAASASRTRPPRTGGRRSTSTSSTPRSSRARPCRSCARPAAARWSSSPRSRATRPQPRAQYAAAKAAEIHLAASLGRELGPDGIRVNALSPGSILFPGGGWDQPARRATRRRSAQWVRDEFPLGRLGHAEEVADVACFLLSARASWISGTNVVVDGAPEPAGHGGLVAAGVAVRRGGRHARQHPGGRTRLLVSSHF